MHADVLQIAIRSDEPYRLQCYGFLSALSSIGGLGKQLLLIESTSTSL